MAAVPFVFTKESRPLRRFTYTWTLGRKRWSIQAEELLKTLMLKHKLFDITYSMNIVAQANFDRLMTDIRAYVDEDSLAMPDFLPKLESKVKDKIRRPREKMVAMGQLVTKDGQYMLHEGSSEGKINIKKMDMVWKLVETLSDDKVLLLSDVIVHNPRERAALLKEAGLLMRRR